METTSADAKAFLAGSSLFGVSLLMERREREEHISTEEC